MAASVIRQPEPTGNAGNPIYNASGQVVGFSPAAPTNNPLTTQYNLYNQGVKQNAEDYSGIMSGYKNLLGQATSGNNAKPYTPAIYTPSPMPTPEKYNYQPGQAPTPYAYQPSADFAGAIKNLQDLSQTGGYSPEALADMRARAISPLRSVYSTAQRNIDRQKVLQGGYSPNYTAATAKMTRDLSDQIANKTTDVNAMIADAVAKGKLTIAPTLATATGQENELKNKIGLGNTEQMNNYLAAVTEAINKFGAGNTDAINAANLANFNARNQAGVLNTGSINEANKFNIQYPQQNTTNAIAALQGMTSLYGVTPALSNTFGNQALQGAQLQNTINQQGQTSGIQGIGQVLSAIPTGGVSSRRA